MKLFATIVLACSITSSQAQLITKKESAAIAGIAREVSENHKPKNYVFRNATLLTMLDSIPKPDQDVLVVDGVIKAIGTDLKEIGDAIEIEAAGQYLMLVGWLLSVLKNMINTKVLRN